MKFLINCLEEYGSASPVIHTFYWNTITEIVEYLIDLHKNAINVLEVGPGTIPFPIATHFIGYNETIKNYINIDIDVSIFPYRSQFFDFVYCRHVLEDIQNPDHAFSEIQRTAKYGYIETPSPMVEISKGIDGHNDGKHTGYIHHRYIVWSFENTIYFLPKYPIVEYLPMNEKYNSILNRYPVYWNNYFLFDQNSKIVIYKNGVNMDIIKDYKSIIETAIKQSFLNTNQFIKQVFNGKP